MTKLKPAEIFLIPEINFVKFKPPRISTIMVIDSWLNIDIYSPVVGWTLLVGVIFLPLYLFNSVQASVPCPDGSYIFANYLSFIPYHNTINYIFSNRTSRLPVLFVFGREEVEVRECEAAFRQAFQSTEDHVLVLYDTVYVHCVGKGLKDLWIHSSTCVQCIGNS